jgi:hypothetical protein
MRARARRRARAEGVSVDEILVSVARKQAASYDIFMSQTIRDAEIVLGFYDLLTEMSADRPARCLRVSEILGAFPETDLRGSRRGGHHVDTKLKAREVASRRPSHNTLISL